MTRVFQKSLKIHYMLLRQLKTNTTVENNIPLGQDIGEEFHLLSKNSIYEHSRKYKYLHIGCVQVAIKPLIDIGIDAAVHNKFEDSLIGTVETSLGQGPVYFNCYPNEMVSLMDRNIIDSLFLNIHFHGLDMKEGSILAALIYRIQYKVMNTCASRVFLKPQKGETTLFITDMTKANVSLPKLIKWDEFPDLAPTIEQIKQDNSGKVEITFNRRNSFSSRIEASRQSEYESARRGLKRQQIHDKFYKFVERVKTNIPFFDWFHAYTVKENIDYPWQHDLIGDPTTNVITNWKIKDDEVIRSELPSTTQYQLPKVKDNNDKPVMATPFKTKDVNKEITPKDIWSLMEQANYTNKYLQVLGESISKEKVFTKPKDHGSSSSTVQMEKPLFRPFKVSEKAKQGFRELRKQKFPIEEVGDSNSELLSKINSLLKTIPETPQPSEESSKIRTRHTSKLINAINEDSDNNSEQVSKEGSVSEKVINPINTKHWKTPSKLYYQRPTTPDLLLEEKGKNSFKSFSANNIYEWNIDAQTEYNIMNTLQHMTMVATRYQMSHECLEKTIVDILVAGFSGQLKRWWDNYLTIEEK
ncbi:polyprotein [Glycine soja]